MQFLLIVGIFAGVALLGMVFVRTEWADKKLWQMQGYNKYPEPSPTSHPPVDQALHRNPSPAPKTSLASRAATQ